MAGDKMGVASSDLPTEPVTTPKQDVSENMGGDAYAAKEARKMMERFAKAAQKQPEPEPEANEEAQPTGEEADPPQTEPAANEEVVSKEQPDDAEPEAPDDDVLSEFNPKSREKLQKRFDKLTAARKEAEEQAKQAAEKAASLEAELAKLREQPPPQEEQAPVVISDDPNDLTAKAATEKEVAEIEREARSTLEFLEENEFAIQKAALADKDTVTLSDGKEYPLKGLVSAKLIAKKQLEKYVPQRREFLKQRTEAVKQSQALFPALFKRDTQEYQTLQSTLRQYPQLKSVPNIELMFGFALYGLTAHQQALKAAEAKKGASPAPPKTGADTAPAVAPAAKKAPSPAKQLEADLAKAQKEFEATGSAQSHQKVLLLRAKLKQLK